MTSGFTKVTILDNPATEGTVVNLVASQAPGAAWYGNFEPRDSNTGSDVYKWFYSATSPFESLDPNGLHDEGVAVLDGDRDGRISIDPEANLFQATLTISDVKDSDAGFYWAVLHDANGVLRSGVFTHSPVPTETVWLRMNDNLPTQVVRDVYGGEFSVSSPTSANTEDLSVVDATGSAGAMVGRALKFGVNDYMVPFDEMFGGDSTGYMMEADCSTAFWVRLENWSAQQGGSYVWEANLLGKIYASGSTFGGWSIGLKSSSPTSGVNWWLRAWPVEGGDPFEYVSSVADFQEYSLIGPGWYHVALVQQTIEGTPVVSFYINGLLKATTLEEPIEYSLNTDRGFMWGTSAWDLGLVFDEFRIYNYSALAPTQVTSLYGEPSAYGPDHVTWDGLSEVNPGLLELSTVPPTVNPWVSYSPEERFRHRMLVFDLNHGAVFPGWGFDMSCFLGVNSSDPGKGQYAIKIFAGGGDGYVYQALHEDSVGAGGPSRRVLWDCVESANPDELKISIVAMGTMFPTDGKEVPGSFLTRLPVLVFYEDGLSAWGVIESNTTNTLVLTESLPRATGVGDVFLLAPMYCGLLSQERRFKYPASPGALRLNCYNNQIADQDMSFAVYGADGNANVFDFDDADMTVELSTSDLEKGRGDIELPRRVASKSLIYALSFYPVGGGVLQIGGLELVEIVHPAEEGRL